MWLAAKRLATIDELLLVEQWFGHPNPDVLVERYDAALEALRDTDVETWLRDASRMGVNESIANRFRSDWLGGARVPGLDRDVMQTRLRDGFTRAITIARAGPLPLSIVLVLNNEDPNTFDVEHARGVNAVTVVIMIPLGGMAAETGQGES